MRVVFAIGVARLADQRACIARLPLPHLNENGGFPAP
jgi:hypothetical protein